MLMLLRYLYPASFRRDFGAEWTRFVQEQRQEPRYRRPVLGSVLYWIDVTRDAVTSGFRMRWSDGAFAGMSNAADVFDLRPDLKGRPQASLADSLLLDLRFALRTFRKSPGFATVAVLTLALGIGGSAAVFTVVNSVILSPLPYPESDQLVRTGAWFSVANNEPRRMQTAPGLRREIQAMTHIVEDAGLYRPPGEISLVGDGEPQRVVAVGVTHNMFEMLGVRPALGRSFLPSDLELSAVEGDADQARHVLVLSHGLWERSYGGDPSIIGRTVRVADDEVHEVIGVMPAGFAFPSPETELWSLLAPPRAAFGGWGWYGVARLQPGLSVAVAQTQLNEIIPRLPEAFPGDGMVQFLQGDGINPRVWVEPLKDMVVGDEVGRTLWIVFGAVVFVLLMACANVANLFLVRAEVRRREIAVRSAVGAGRGRLARHFLAEGTGIATVGGLLGLGLAIAAARLLVRFGPADLPRLQEVSVDPTVVVFTAAAALLTGALFGAIALAHSRSRALTALKEGTQGGTDGLSRFRMRNMLVVTQVAFALVLLVGSGLMIRSFWHLTRVDAGFDPTNVLTFDLGLTRDYANQGDRRAFHEELIDRLGGLPGVEAVTATTCFPLRGTKCGGAHGLAEQNASLDFQLVGVVQASADYFETLRIPLLSGRLFGSDPADSLSVVLSASAAADRWPGEDPLGKVVKLGGKYSGWWFTVVGVVGDVPVAELTGNELPEFRRLVYQPRGAPDVGERNMSFVLRTSTPPLGLADAARDVVRSMDPDLAVAHMQPMEENVRIARASMAFTMVLIIAAGVTALLLGVIGIYGVIAYVVGRRTSEIGIRMALGAKATDVKAMVLRQGGRVVVLGVLIGLLGAFALTRMMESVVFGVSPTDPATYIASSVGLLVIALLATYLPARRAANVDPVEALRAD